ncbi:hypothetical protein A2U01_0083113, partial [Trifolium medium]|nr:hypothetical protein [Trifolium medium]
GKEMMGCAGVKSKHLGRVTTAVTKSSLKGKSS